MNTILKTSVGAIAIAALMFGCCEKLRSALYCPGRLSSRCFGKTEGQVEARENPQGEVVTYGATSTRQLHRGDSSH